MHGLNRSDIKRLLVLDLGQVGDVIMSFPALQSIREGFPTAEITVLAGKTPAELIDELRLADKVIAVDRVALLRGNKLSSIGKILKLVAEIRRLRFEFIIDLHSLHESNLLGYISGAKFRLFGNRESRSLDVLSNFRPRPPREDKAKHLAEYYLDVLKPLRLSDASIHIELKPQGNLIEAFRKRYLADIPDGMNLVGLFVGAGNNSRRWAIDKFAALSRRLADELGARPIVFLGPEEHGMEAVIRDEFHQSTVIVPGLRLTELMGAFASLDLLVGNDTGPTHLAAVVGTPIVLIGDIRAPSRYRPLTKEARLVKSGTIDEIALPEVWSEVVAALSTAGRSKLERVLP